MLKYSSLFLFFVACSQEPQPVSTGCWTGVDKLGARKLIGCYTQAQVVQAEQSQSWALILAQYRDLKYDYSVNCVDCEKRYPH